MNEIDDGLAKGFKQQVASLYAVYFNAMIGANGVPEAMTEPGERFKRGLQVAVDAYERTKLLSESIDSGSLK